MDKLLVNRILKLYDINSYLKLEKIDTGFYQDGVLLNTNIGKVVLRQVFGRPFEINKMMYIYEFLNQNDFKTPTPILTTNGAYFAEVAVDRFVIQKYIDGSPVKTETKNKTLTFTRIIGEILSKMHRTLSKIDFDTYGLYIPNYQYNTTIHKLKNTKIHNDHIHFPEYGGNLANDYVVNQYQKWLKTSEDINFNSLSSGVCHNKPSFKDFLFDGNEEFVGVLDFSSAGYNYYIYDIATFMMYTGLYQEDISKLFLVDFISAYMKNNIINKSELRYLHFFVQTTTLLQVFYNFYQLYQGKIRGEDTEKRKNKFDASVLILRKLEDLPENYYTNLINKKM